MPGFRKMHDKCQEGIKKRVRGEFNFVFISLTFLKKTMNLEKKTKKRFFNKANALFFNRLGC